MPETNQRRYQMRHKAKGRCRECPRKVGTHGGVRCRRCRKAHNLGQNESNRRRRLAEQATEQE